MHRSAPSRLPITGDESHRLLPRGAGTDTAALPGGAPTDRRDAPRVSFWRRRAWRRRL